jgi:putative flavoprotein involved in K+ transport
MSILFFDVIIAGAGHAGLSASYHLTQYGLKHIVFERGSIGESWQSQRWDSFKLNTANKLNVFPGFDYQGSDPDGFSTAQQFVTMLKNYAAAFKLPVAENTTILSVEKKMGQKIFSVTVKENGVVKNYYAKQVIIASGMQNEIQIPSVAGFVDAGVKQLHTSQYRSAEGLPPGSVLVAGSGQSGCQIAEDLADNGRKVYFATSNVPRLPRNYRGRDIIDWLLATGFFEVKKEDITNPKMLHLPSPQLSAVHGHTISLQSLAKKGVTLLGTLKNASAENILFDKNMAAHVQFADAFSKNVKDMIDGFIEKTGTDAPMPEPDAEDEPDTAIADTVPVTWLNLKDAGITSVIWATGFTNNFDYIKLPVFDNDKNILHQNGVSVTEGLYFLGLPWLRKRKSVIINGTDEDAAFICEKVYHHSMHLSKETVAAMEGGYKRFYHGLI